MGFLELFQVNKMENEVSRFMLSQGNGRMDL